MESAKLCKNNYCGDNCTGKPIKISIMLIVAYCSKSIQVKETAAHNVHEDAIKGICTV